jgi:hypothetical protein
VPQSCSTAPQPWGSSASHRACQHLLESTICPDGAPRPVVTPLRPPGRSPVAPCPVRSKAAVSSVRFVDDAKLHHRAQINRRRLRSSCPIAPPGGSTAAPCLVHSKAAVSLGRFADDAKLSSIARLKETEGGSAPSTTLDSYCAFLAGCSAPPTSSTPMSFTRRRASISFKQQRDVVLKAHVVSVHFKYFRCILQALF